MEDVVEKLKELGFNSYEAKVYLALLKKYPATGYEVSKIADIPQARAYDTLKSLELSSVVFSSNDKPQKYTPISPKELTSRFKRKIVSTIDYLEKSLPQVKEDYNEPIQSIMTYTQILSKLKEIINNTKSSLYLEIWDCDFKQLESVLCNAYDRGVDIKIVGFDNLISPFGLIYQHEGGKEIANINGGRLVYLLSDSSECLFGKIESKVVWTKNPDVILMLKEFIVHEMYLLDIKKQFPEQLKYFYGPGLRKLRDKIINKNSGSGIF